MLATAIRPSVSISTAAEDAFLTGISDRLTASAPLGASDCLPGPVATHLRSWAGYTSRSARLRVVAHQSNALPGWSGGPNLLTGVVDPAGHATIAVPPRSAPAVTALVRYQLRAPLDAHLTCEQLAAVTAGVPALLGRPGEHVEQIALRWTVAPADLPSVGTWIAVDDPRLPSWLRPFGGPALCALGAAGHVVAGVGIKRHGPRVHELAVVTEPGARGQGLARCLVAQAARHLLDRGVVPIYLHAVGNVASARVAEAAGFPRNGWSGLLLSSAT
jgi:GNAT superfamily N-acetyltransferase